VTTTSTFARRRLQHVGYAIAVTPLLRWLVAHHTVPAGQPWRTHCDTCHTALWPAACTPSGRCRTCRARIGASPYLPEAVAAAAFALLVWSGDRGWQLAAYTWWTTGILVLALVDATVLRLPHRLTAATTAGTVLLLAPLDAPASSWWSAAIGAASLAGFYTIVHIVTRGDLGLGDVALAVPIGVAVGWLDWRLVVTAVLLGHTLAAASIPVRRLTRTNTAPLPLGTYLIAASFAVVVLAGTT
jgi:leader peptidase (prepilin peptidase)/N-methyltransferase